MQPNRRNCWLLFYFLSMTIRDKYNEFIEENGHEPEYAHASIIWLDTKERGDFYCFKMSSTIDEKTDDSIFYYCDSVNDLESFTKPGVEDFIILPGSVEFADEI